MKTLIPKLRFPEFKSKLESKSLGEVLVKVVNPVKVDPEVTYQEIGIRSHGKGIFHKQPIIGKALGNKRVFHVASNLFIVNIVFAWERAIAVTSDSENGKIASHRFPMYAPNRNEANVEYLRQFFLTPKGKYLLELASPGGAGRNKTLGQSNFEKIKLALPCGDEQKKIAEFFITVDEKIESLASELNFLKRYKSGVIQKIFSQEIKFKDDKGNQYPAWEEKKLGDIGTFQTSSIDKLTRENESKVFLVNYMNVYRHENINSQTIKSYQIVSAKESQIKNCCLRKGDILFTPSSETPTDIGHSVVISEDLDNVVYSYHLMRFRPKLEIDILYSHYFCNTPSVLSQLTKLATGATRCTISVKSFSSIKVSLPCLEEQNKIALFLSALDEKISNIKKQLDLTTQYKQGLLQQMFI